MGSGLTSKPRPGRANDNKVLKCLVVQALDGSSSLKLSVLFLRLFQLPKFLLKSRADRHFNSCSSCPRTTTKEQLFLPAIGWNLPTKTSHGQHDA